MSQAINSHLLSSKKTWRWMLLNFVLKKPLSTTISLKFFKCSWTNLISNNATYDVETYSWKMVILELKTWFRQRVMHTTVHCRGESISLVSHSTIVGWNPVWGYSYFHFNETFMKYFKLKIRQILYKYLVKLQRYKSIV